MTITVPEEPRPFALTPAQLVAAAIKCLTVSNTEMNVNPNLLDAQGTALRVRRGRAQLFRQVVVRDAVADPTNIFGGNPVTLAYFTLPRKVLLDIEFNTQSTLVKTGTVSFVADLTRTGTTTSAGLRSMKGGDVNVLVYGYTYTGGTIARLYMHFFIGPPLPPAIYNGELAAVYNSYVPAFTWSSGSWTGTMCVADSTYTSTLDAKETAVNAAEPGITKFVFGIARADLTATASPSVTFIIRRVTEQTTSIEEDAIFL